MKKYLINALLTMILVFGFVSAHAARDIPAVENTVSEYILQIDGVAINYPDQQPVLINYSGEEVLYVPLRATYEFLGFEVMWDDTLRVATAARDDVIISFPQGEAAQYVNEAMQPLDRPILVDKGRTLVSAISLVKALGYILSWDDISGVLDVVSPGSLNREFIYKQSTHQDANKFLQEYDGFTGIAEKDFVIPGLNEYLVPQGLSYREDKNHFYLSGYFKSNAMNSVICVVDAASGKSVGEYYLYTPEGLPFYGHVGGIAVTPQNLYIADEGAVYRISLNTIDSLGSKGALYPEERILLSSGASNSFMDYSGGYLWMGNFYDPQTPSYSAKAHESYGSLIRAYKLDETSTSGFSEARRTTNTNEYDYIPDAVYTYDKLKIQGITTCRNKMYLAASFGKWAEFYVYDLPVEDEKYSSLIMDGDKEVPLYSLMCRSTLIPIPRIEEIVTVGESIYAGFESGAIIYRSKSGDSTTDSVWKIPLSRLEDQ